MAEVAGGTDDPRECIVDPMGGPIEVVLMANNTLRAGGEFAIFPEGEGEARSRWKMAAGDSGSHSHPVDLDVATLDRNRMTWQVLVCAVVESLSSGVVEIQVHQDGVSRPLSKAARWKLQEIPVCSSDRTKRITAKLAFAFGASEES